MYYSDHEFKQLTDVFTLSFAHFGQIFKKYFKFDPSNICYLIYLFANVCKYVMKT